MGIGFLKGVIAILRGQKSPAATAAGFAVGAILGLLPKGNLLGIFFFLLFFLTTVDKPAAILASLLWTPVGLLVDSLAHQIGYAVLSLEALGPLWTALYNTPIVPWTHFNNTVVIGQLIIGLALFLPNYLAMKKAVAYYQQNLKPKVDKLKVIQALKAMRWYQWYESMSE
ncbi:MAG: TIGR03546 family protein [Elusimicrobia bacterium]|nr:TIGR03546 family protein [Elusimicrobiota bacterium]